MAGPYQPGSTLTALFGTADQATGAAANPTTITGTLYRNGVADTVSVTMATVATGLLSAVAVVPGGYAVGDQVDVVATPVYVSGGVTTTARAVVFAGRLDVSGATIASYVDTEVAAIKAKTDLIPASPASAGGAMALTAGERDAIADAILDRANAIETGLTPRGALRLIGATAVGKLSGANTATETFRNPVADSKARVVATVDAAGNRTAITWDAT